MVWGISKAFQFIFESFLHRDQAYEQICAVWEPTQDPVNEIPEKLLIFSGSLEESQTQSF
jgi:hypothetical protein